MASIRLSATAMHGGENLLDIVAEGEAEGRMVSLSSRLSMRLGVEDGEWKGSGLVEVVAKAVGDASADTEVRIPESLAPWIETLWDRVEEMKEQGLQITESSQTRFSFRDLLDHTPGEASGHPQEGALDNDDLSDVLDLIAARWGDQRPEDLPPGLADWLITRLAHEDAGKAGLAGSEAPAPDLPAFSLMSWDALLAPTPVLSDGLELI